MQSKSRAVPRKSAKAAPSVKKRLTAKAKQSAKPKVRVRRHRKQGSLDMAFLLLVLILCAFGLLMVFSASYAYASYYIGNSFHYIQKQAVFAAMGLVAMLVLSRIPYYIYKNISSFIYLFALFLMLLVVIANGGGAGRFINIAGTTFQPSELMKFAIIVIFADLIGKNYSKMDTLRYGIIPFLVALVPVILILVVFQRHLSATIIICAIGAVMMFVGGMKLRYFMPFIPVGVLVVLGVIMVKGVDYWGERISGWMDPFSDVSNTTWQTVQSLVAIGSGGLMGLGLGNSRQKYLYLPEPQNDFIFAIVCEELGLIGAILVIVLFALLVYRGFSIANKAPNKFAAMLVVGIVFQIALQAILNIGVVCNAIPNTGISLPFFSYGGTALMVQMAEMGVVLNVSRYTMIEDQEGGELR